MILTRNHLLSKAINQCLKLLPYLTPVQYSKHIIYFLYLASKPIIKGIVTRFWCRHSVTFTMMHNDRCSDAVITVIRFIYIKNIYNKVIYDKCSLKFLTALSKKIFLYIVFFSESKNKNCEAVNSMQKKCTSQL